MKKLDFEEKKKRQTIRNKIYYEQHKHEVNKKRREWKLKNKDRSISTRKKYERGLFTVVLDHYGHQCGNCGETNELFLTIDHINNDGYKDHRTGPTLYKAIISENFPKTFQVLCYNCNCGKARNGGILPRVKLRLDHVGWVSNNLTTFEEFWVNLLGFKQVWASNILPEKTRFLFGTDRTATAYRYQKDNMSIELHVFTPPILDIQNQRFDVLGINHVALYVDSRQKFLSDLSQKNPKIAETFHVFHDPSGWDNIFIQDFEGNWIELRTDL